LAEEKILKRWKQKRIKKQREVVEKGWPNFLCDLFSYFLSFQYCLLEHLFVNIRLIDGPGINFINVLRTAFMNAYPNIVKTTHDFAVYFTFSGSACAKAAWRTLMKLTPDGMSISKHCSARSLIFNSHKFVCGPQFYNTFFLVPTPKHLFCNTL